MIAATELQHVLSEERAARKEVAASLRRTQEARLAVQRRRNRARRELGRLEETVEQLSVTLAQGTPGIEWTSPRDALDDVLYPVD